MKAGMKEYMRTLVIKIILLLIMLDPAEIPHNLYNTGFGIFTLSDDNSSKYEKLRDENRASAFNYELGCYIYGIIFSLLAIPFLFFNNTRKYALIYIGLCIIWAIWYRNYAWNKWAQVTIKMQNFINDNKF